MGVGVGDGDGEGNGIYHDRRAARSRGGVCSMVFCIVVGGGGCGRYFGIVTFRATVINVCPDNARVAFTVLEGYMLKVDANIYNAQQHSSTVVALCKPLTDGCCRIGQHIARMGY